MIRWLSFRFSALIVVAGVISSLPLTAAAESALQRQLNDQYKGKTFVLRGFYPGNHLRYDSGGHAI